MHRPTQQAYSRYNDNSSNEKLAFPSGATMSLDKNGSKNKSLNAADPEDESGESGSTGQGGRIEFRDFMATTANIRDDLLPFEEKKRLLGMIKDYHELKVKDQKNKRDDYKQLKEGKVTLKDFRNGLAAAAGMSSQYKANPALANKAQFSGIDRQVNPLATENVADTNNDKRNELTLDHRLTNKPAPAFNPKPRGPGY